MDERVEMVPSDAPPTDPRGVVNMDGAMSSSLSEKRLWQNQLSVQIKEVVRITGHTTEHSRTWAAHVAESRSQMSSSFACPVFWAPLDGSSVDWTVHSATTESTPH